MTRLSCGEGSGSRGADGRTEDANSLHPAVHATLAPKSSAPSAPWWKCSPGLAAAFALSSGALLVGTPILSAHTHPGDAPLTRVPGSAVRAPAIPTTEPQPAFFQELVTWFEAQRPPVPSEARGRP